MRMLPIAAFTAITFCLFHLPAFAAGPNILLILADDLGYSNLSCYGGTDLRTPNIDRLVARGMRFDNFYANSCVCSPTRAALLTGRYPDRVGVPGVIRTHADQNFGYLRADAVLLPQLLARAGYDTALVGKWHLGLSSPNLPNERGFAHFHGFLGDMMDDYRTHLRHEINYLRKNADTIQPTGHATDLFTDWACDYLRRQTAKRPFFLYLAYNAPHTPLEPPQDWLHRVQKREPKLSAQRARLVALIEHLDDGIGRVLKTLDETGLSQNTLVVFTSDNGGPLLGGHNANPPFRDGKGSLYEGGLRVPLVAAWPERISPASRSDRVALSMDVFPTLCEAAGVKPSAPGESAIDGRSFYPTLLGKAQLPDQRDLYFTYREGGKQLAKTKDAVRRGDWKLIHPGPFAPLELYNLKLDPAEGNNVAAKHPKIVDELSAVLRTHIQRRGAVPWQK
jgi:arylsulfatase A-like enzyme